jgi:hypothetical protein
MTKYAVISADLEDYDTAMGALTELAVHCLESNLTKFSARNYFFKAGLLLVAQGYVLRIARVSTLGWFYDH